MSPVAVLSHEHFNVPAGIVTRAGGTLYRSGQPWTWVGLDAYDLATYEGSTYSAADLDAFFSALQPGRTVIRVWATKLASVAAVDQVVARAEASNVALILSLIDGQNNSNASGDTVDSNFILMTGATWTSYVNWIATICPRYPGSPAIMAWEPGNELDDGGGAGVTAAQLQAFHQAACTLIKTQDPTHLTESGVDGNGAAANMSGTPVHWQTAHDAPALDICSIHDYQYDQGLGTGVSTHWAPAVTAAAALDGGAGKPVICGEFGAVLNQPNADLCYDPGHTVDWLAALKYAAYLGGGAAGACMWDWMKAHPSWLGTGCGLSNGHFFYGTASGSGTAVVALIRDWTF